MIGLNPVSGGSRQEIARGLLGLRFEYFDGFDWYDTWGEVEGRDKHSNSLKEHPNLSGMPEAVRITLWLDPNPRSHSTNTASSTQDTATTEPPLVFQTVARLNLAAISSQGSTASGSAASDSNDANGTPNGGMNQ